MSLSYSSALWNYVCHGLKGRILLRSAFPGAIFKSKWHCFVGWIPLPMSQAPGEYNHSHALRISLCPVCLATL